MNKKEENLIKKVIEKKEYSQLPIKDVKSVFEKFNKDDFSDEEKVKFTRDFLRKVFLGFSGRKLLVFKNKSIEEILRKHLSTRERYPYYTEVYERILKNLPDKINILDFGAGVNGLSYDFINKIGKQADYIGIEAIGQIVDLVNEYFKREKVKGKMIHLSLFELEKVKKIINKTDKPRVVFLFKVIDSLEKFERDYTKILLKEIVSKVDRIVISFATESWVKRKKFYVSRKWLIDFIKENWQFIDDFKLGGERYLVFENYNRL